MEPDEKRTAWWCQPITLGLLAFALVVVLWLAALPILHWYLPDRVRDGPSGQELIQRTAERGQVGDAFGALNALFSGLAFAGLIVALFMQRTELGLQRAELRLQRIELEETRGVLKQTLHAQTYGVVHGILQSEEVRQARRKTFTTFAKDDYSNPDTLTSDARNAAEIVCHTFDSAGLLVRHGLLPAEHVAHPYAHALTKCWERLSPLVVAYRKQRAAPELWAAFEELAGHAARFKEAQRVVS